MGYQLLVSGALRSVILTPSRGITWQWTPLLGGSWGGTFAISVNSKLEQTSTFQVICQVSNMKPRGKVFRVSPQTNCGEALRVALRKFGLSHVDPALFCLLPVHKDTGGRYPNTFTNKALGYGVQTLHRATAARLNSAMSFWVYLP